MDDYYSLLGIDADAATDEIRTAYRDKKTQLEGKADKSEIARVNKAWNVLSDPYQRGRYDEQRILAAADEGIDLTAEERVPAESAPPPRRRGFLTPPDRNAPPPQPTIVVPGGKHFAPQRKRVIAMAIDLFVLLLFFIGAQVLFPMLADDRYPTETALLEDVQDRIDVLDAREDAIDDAENELEDLRDNPEATETQVADAQAAVEKAEADLATAEEPAAALLERCDAEGYDTEVETDEGDDPPTVRDRVNECGLDVQRGLQGLYFTVMEIFFLVSLLYLVVPSALTGQTLGKRLQGIRVVRVDGSPLGWGGALKRFGLIVLVANVLFFILQVFAGIILLMGVLGWMRNPNQQGMHDRAAKTIVIED